MITNHQKEFLRRLLTGEFHKEDDPRKYSATMIRIQKTVDRAMANTVWMVDNCIEILKDENTEIDDETLERYRRFKTFLYIVKSLNPMVDIEHSELNEMLKRLAQLHPKYNFEVMRKREGSDR